MHDPIGEADLCLLVQPLDHRAAKFLHQAVFGPSFVSQVRLRIDMAGLHFTGVTNIYNIVANNPLVKGPLSSLLFFGGLPARLAEIALLGRLWRLEGAKEKPHRSRDGAQNRRELCYLSDPLQIFFRKLGVPVEDRLIQFLRGDGLKGSL